MSQIRIDICCLKKLVRDIENNEVPEVTIKQLKRLIEVEELAEKQRIVRKGLGLTKKSTS